MLTWIPYLKVRLNQNFNLKPRGLRCANPLYRHIVHQKGCYFQAVAELFHNYEMRALQADQGPVGSPTAGQGVMLCGRDIIIESNFPKKRKSSPYG